MHYQEQRECLQKKLTKKTFINQNMNIIGTFRFG